MSRSKVDSGVKKDLKTSLAGGAGICVFILAGWMSATIAQTVSEQSAGIQIDENEPVLETVIVQGEEGIAVLESPAILTHRTTAQEIRQKQIENVRDAGRLDPALSYNARTQGFVIRGLDNNRILTTLDGIRIPWLRDPARGTIGGTTSFDFNALSSLDIVHGGDSSLYGSGVLGGVVALRTLEPEDLLTDEKDWASITKGSYDSVDESWRVDEAFAMRSEQTVILFQGGYTKGKERKNHGTINGFGSARTKPEPVGFEQNNLMFKAYHNVDNTHRFGLTLERFKADRQTVDVLASAAIYVPGRKIDEQERQRERVSFSYDFTGEGLLDEFHMLAYWQRQQLVDATSADRLVKPAGFYSRRSSLEDESYGLLVGGNRNLVAGDVGHHLRFAADLRFGNYRQYAAGQDNCPPPPYGNPFDACWFLHVNQSDSPNTESKVLGFAFEDEMTFPDGRLRITPGLRFDYFRHSPQKSAEYERNIGFIGTYPASRRDFNLSPKLRIEYDLRDDLTLYAQWAKSFRAPDAAELYQFYINPGRYYLRGNPDLKPETGNSFDVGARFGDNALGGSVSLFTNRYRNFIDTVDLGAGFGFMLFRQEYVNRARVHISGAEARGHWQFHQNWRVQAGLAYAQGKDSDRNEYLHSVPPFKAVMGLGYARENWGGDVTMTAVGKRSKIETGAHDLLKTPGYALLDITGWWQPLGEKGPRLQAGIYNLFDRKYWDAVSLPAGTPAQAGQDYAYYTEPGRSFKFSLTQKF